ncbi:hypothetical protein EUGRSUZ_L01433 [Eucalyptus grandis]|uniref:Lipoxygenase n=1 Tax=Eucalyptus grandis TaxID=71139 RepID=A0A058ZUF9_EUCGR|nr:hypothetical protein EUGRSUZ_L01433 [Eucalyptus grandis]
MDKVSHGILPAFDGGDEAGGSKKVKGTVVLMKKNVLNFNDFNASVLDLVFELFGQKVSLQLVSAVHGDPEKGLRGKLGKPAYLEDWITTSTLLKAGDSAFMVTFDWDEEVGVPGAIIVQNKHHRQFYLKTVTLEDVPGEGRVHFVCNSWVYPADRYKKERVFFSNKTYLPGQTPAPLVKYREEELVNLRGDGTGELQEWDRVYDYAYYNDLGNPDKDAKYARPVLGGSAEYPYPRRGRTGRPPTKTDPNTERRVPALMSLDIYVPRDEWFGHLKMSDFLAYALKAVAQLLKRKLESVCAKTPNEFDSFEDVLKLYKGSIKLASPLLESLEESIPLEMIKERCCAENKTAWRTVVEFSRKMLAGVTPALIRLLKYPMPQVIKENKTAWRTDVEFGREMLAGVNPVLIRRLEEFPPASKLDPKIYGNQSSTIREELIQKQLNGLTVKQVIKKNKLFILDHHDAIMPYLRRINTTTTKTYATRTLLFLKDDGTLKPLAIELSLPHPEGDEFGAISKVYMPADQGVEGSIWQLAKAYAAVNDSGYHQLISHWLNTHAAIEPFVIATNRQLSALHPIYKLLHPHFRDTMTINAFARQILINAGGILEATVFPAKYAMEMSSAVYKNWIFPEQALPADLIKR